MTFLYLSGLSILLFSADFSNTSFETSDGVNRLNLLLKPREYRLIGWADHLSLAAPIVP